MYGPQWQSKTFGGGGDVGSPARPDNNPRSSHRFAGVVKAVRVIACGSAQFPKRNRQHGIFSLLNMKPSSCNLTRCLPAPLIMADVLALRLPVAADRDLACKEGPRSRRDKNNRPQHTQVRGRRCSASLYLNLLFERHHCPGADGVAGLVHPCPIAIQKVTVNQQQRADPIWARISSIWSPSIAAPAGSSGRVRVPWDCKAHSVVRLQREGEQDSSW
jgi:hypothetical protein